MIKDKSFSLSTFVFIFNKELNKILLIKRNEEKRLKWGFDWGIIGGKVEPGEYSIEAAIREIKEETAIVLKKESLSFMKYEERPSKVHTPAVHFFYIAVIDENSPIIINKESEEFAWFNIKELPKSMIETPKVIREALNFTKKFNQKNE